MKELDIQNIVLSLDWSILQSPYLWTSGCAYVRFLYLSIFSGLSLFEVNYILNNTKIAK